MTPLGGDVSGGDATGAVVSAAGWPDGSSFAGGSSGVPLTGGPPGGPELESELLGIMLSATYQRFARAAPAYGTAGQRGLLRFKDHNRQRALPASRPHPAPVDALAAERGGKYAASDHPSAIGAHPADATNGTAAIAQVSHPYHEGIPPSRWAESA